MGDKRFEERLKRIEARARSGAGVELLAGVGDIAETRASLGTASVAAQRHSASFLLILLGALTGYLSFDLLRDLVGLQTLVAIPPEDLLDFLRANPPVAAAATTLALCALTAIASFLHGRRAVRLMSFSCAALGAALGAALPALA